MAIGNGRERDVSGRTHTRPRAADRESGIPLEEAFADSYALFNETTRRYMEAYKQLEEQFEFLNVRLEETNRALRDSLEEKDRVSNYLTNILESMTDGLLVVGLATAW